MGLAAIRSAIERPAQLQSQLESFQHALLFNTRSRDIDAPLGDPDEA
jgi:hypothetical protein